MDEKAEKAAIKVEKAKRAAIAKVQRSRVMVGVSILQVLMEVARSYGLGVAGEKLTRRLRQSTFASMLKQNIGWFDEPNNSAANLSANLSRDVTLVSAVTGKKNAICFKKSDMSLALQFSIGG
ncbi:hypothetical protein T492DRAFT_844520 [Pavlovales sp. CCMP2436]|nr:hypothetical protein T492DRAFT_844520 [Pavlovales sp. CCMP2436]